MFGCMKLIRFLSSLVVSIILFLVIFFGIPIATTTQFLSSSQDLKFWFSESKIYDNFAQIISENIIKQSEYEHANDETALTNEELSGIVKSTFDAKWLQENTESLFDSLYSFLKGESENLSFTISLGDKRETLVNNIADTLSTKIEALPLCSAEINTSEDFDPFTSNCKPQGFDSASWTDEISKNILEGDTFASDSEFTADDLKIDQRVLSNLKRIYSIFSKIYIGVYVLIGIVSLILFLDVPKFSTKFVVVGLVWLASGSALIFSTFYIKRNIESAVQTILKRSNLTIDESTLDSFMNTIKIAHSDIASKMTRPVLIIVVLGATFLIAGLLAKLARSAVNIEKAESPAKNEIKPVKEQIVPEQKITPDKRLMEEISEVDRVMGSNTQNQASTQKNLSSEGTPVGPAQMKPVSQNTPVNDLGQNQPQGGNPAAQKNYTPQGNLPPINLK